MVGLMLKTVVEPSNEVLEEKIHEAYDYSEHKRGNQYKHRASLKLAVRGPSDFVLHLMDNT